MLRIKDHAPLHKVPSFACAILMVTACTGLSNPTQANVTFTSDDAFVFETRGTWDAPANAKGAEKHRLDFIADELQRQHRCAYGFIIHQRKTPSSATAWKHDEDADEIVPIRYEGTCLKETEQH